MLTPDSALFTAIQAGDSQGVRDALRRGAKPDVVDHEGFTPLIRAIAQGKAETVKVLLNGGADIQLACTYPKAPWSPLTFAAWRGNNELVAALLLRGANPRMRDPLGRTALIVATELGREMVVDGLLNHDSSLVDMVTVEERTALMYAATLGRLSILRRLVDAGAGLDRQDRIGRCALMDAVIHRHPEAVDSLLQLGANPDLQDRDGLTALMHACAGALEKSVQRLLDGNANPLLEDGRGRRARHHLEARRPEWASQVAERLNGP